MVFSGYIPSSGIAGSCSNFIFSFLEDTLYCSPYVTVVYISLIISDAEILEL